MKRKAWLQLGLAFLGLLLLAHSLERLRFFALPGAWSVPDYVQSLIIFTGFFFGPIYGMVLGLLAGFLQDSLGGIVLGPALLAGLYGGFGAGSGLASRFPEKKGALLLQWLWLSLGMQVIEGLVYWLWPQALPARLPLGRIFQGQLYDWILGLPGQAFFLLFLVGACQAGLQRLVQATEERKQKQLSDWIEGRGGWPAKTSSPYQK